MEPLIVIAALTAAVWTAVFFLRGGLLAGGAIVLLAGTSYGFFAWHAATTPIALTTDRVLWVLLMGQLFFWWRMGLTASHRIGRTEGRELACPARNRRSPRCRDGRDAGRL